jgi:hypothetical protein
MRADLMPLLVEDILFGMIMYKDLMIILELMIFFLNFFILKNPDSKFRSIWLL